MQKRLKISLIIFALALVLCLACFVWLLSRPNEGAPNLAGTTSGPAFEVIIEKPRMDRPFFGIIPTRLEAKIFGVSDLQFDQASRGARVGGIGNGYVDLHADGWDLHIETNGEGKVDPGTRVVFPIEIAEKQWTMRCRPAEQAVGFLHVATPPGSNEFEGNFVVEFANCEDAKTGKILDTEAGARPGDAWPSAPLTVRGSFTGLSPASR
jgi:hypothetical protein